MRERFWVLDGRNACSKLELQAICRCHFYQHIPWGFGVYVGKNVQSLLNFPTTSVTSQFNWYWFYTISLETQKYMWIFHFWSRTTSIRPNDRSWQWSHPTFWRRFQTYSLIERRILVGVTAMDNQLSDSSSSRKCRDWSGFQDSWGEFVKMIWWLKIKKMWLKVVWMWVIENCFQNYFSKINSWSISWSTCWSTCWSTLWIWWNFVGLLKSFHKSCGRISVVRRKLFERAFWLSRSLARELPINWCVSCWKVSSKLLFRKK